jgi:hypothetical protein
MKTKFYFSLMAIALSVSAFARMDVKPDEDVFVAG